MRFLGFFKANSRSFIFFIISILYALSQAGNFFFWDTISQVSAPANWYYNNNFSSLLVPDEIATGHPPFFALYIALTWKILGKSLLVSHLALVPFIFGILYQAERFISKSGSAGYANTIILAAIIADTTFLSQLSMITFDIVQLFLFLWCLNALLESRKSAMAVAFAGLCLINLRGSISASGLILFILARNYYKYGKIRLGSLLPCLPGILLLLLFLIYFYFDKHWIIHNSVSGRWAQSAEFASTYEIFRNGGIILWRLSDYGRIGILTCFLLILIRAARMKTLFDDFFSDTLLIAVSQMVVIAPFLLFYRNFIGHRYLLPVIIMVSISVVYWVIRYSKYTKIILTFLFFILLSGHFWIYPKTIAQGWDATTAHWPYYRIRKDMVDYIKSENIPVKYIGSFFPNLARFEDIDLSGSQDSFKYADIERDSLILFSNIFNVPDPVISELYESGKWTQRHYVGRRGVFLVLFERRDSHPLIILTDTPIP